MTEIKNKLLTMAQPGGHFVTIGFSDFRNYYTLKIKQFISYLFFKQTDN